METADLARENALLKARLVEVEAQLAEVQEANRRLQDILHAAQHEKFGKRSEKLSPDQFNLPLEDAEFAQGVLEAAQGKAEAAMQRARGETPRKPARNRGHLPPHLPRTLRVIEPASTLCPCGCGEMAKIGEDVSERLDVIPAQFRVLVTRRPKYACRRCSQGMVQAHAPEHVVPGGLPTEQLIAWIMVSKFGDHLPFYRQAEIFKRQGIHLDRGTLGNWVGRACFHLMPVINHMRAICGVLTVSWWMKPARRCWTRAERPPRAASSGRLSPMIAAMAAPARPSCCSTMPPAGGKSTR